jgi:hypothetical protein
VETRMGLPGVTDQEIEIYAQDASIRDGG